MMKLIAIFIGGGAGSLARFAIGLAAARWGGSFPIGTLLSNLLACAIIGVLASWSGWKEQGMVSYTWLLLATGFCGGLSTFSTFGLETVELFRQGLGGLALINIGISVVMCILVVWMMSGIRP